MSLSWPEAFSLWCAQSQRGRLLSTSRHGEFMRVLNGDMTVPDRVATLKAARSASFFVVQDADQRQQLYTIRLQVDQTSAEKGKWKKAKKLSKVEKTTFEHSGPLLVTDCMDPRAVSVAWGENGGNTTNPITFLRVLPADEIPAEMSRIHNANHETSRVLYHDLNSRIYGIPRIVCEALVTRCPQCNPQVMRCIQYNPQFKVTPEQQKPVPVSSTPNTLLFDVPDDNMSTQLSASDVNAIITIPLQWVTKWTRTSKSHTIEFEMTANTGQYENKRTYRRREIRQ